MKLKNVLITVSILTIISIIPVKAEERVTGEYGTYSKAIQIIQEVMRDYYIKEDRFQYNYSRADYGTNSPEEATHQDNKHLVCASYTYSTYAEAFGVDTHVDKFPIYNYSITAAGADYYENNKDNKAKLDGNYLLYYERKADNIQYVYENKKTINEFAQMIRPGDLFTYTGHAMIAYKTVERTPGNFDVLMLNSVGGSQVRTRIDGTSKIFHNLIPSSHGHQNVIDVDHQGSVQYFWLSESTKFFTNGVLKCSEAECTVIRMFYEGPDDKAIFNYSILPTKYAKSELRLEYPGLYIEKTVDKIDNNTVYLEDELEYTIKIINKSNTTFNGVNYGKFYVVEALGDYVEYVSSTGKLKNNNVEFTINSLNVGASIELKYKVRVKNNYNAVGQSILATGNFKKNLNSDISIGTGTVENYVALKPKVTTKSYSECYNTLKNNKAGLELINEIYKCSLEENFHFDEFQFDKLLTKKNITSKGATNAIVFKSDMTSQYQIYKEMILDNLWGGLVELHPNGVNDETDMVYTLPRWGGSVSSTRARNIHPEFFKEGDVLIYSVDYSKTANSLKHTKENGIYAYIYLDGKFVGINGSGDTSRNEYTYNYYNDKSLNITTHLYSGYSSLTSEYDVEEILEYANYEALFDKDYYVVLRPEFALKDYEKISKDDISSSTYIIGNYMFTRNKNSNYDGKLTTNRIMLASKTLLSDTEADMIIYYKKSDGTWIDALTGDGVVPPTSFDIKVKDLTEEIPDSAPLDEDSYNFVAPVNIYGSAYVIGSHIFTRNQSDIYNGVITTKLIMLASKTAKGNKESDMIIYYKKPNGDWINALTGAEIDLPTYFKIKYVDLESYTD